MTPTLGDAKHKQICSIVPNNVNFYASKKYLIFFTSYHHILEMAMEFVTNIMKQCANYLPSLVFCFTKCFSKKTKGF